MVTLHAEPICVRYHANKLSCASFCNVLYWVVLLVVPYVLAYVAGGLWSSDVLGHEQPAVRFRHEALVEAHATSATSTLVTLGWSSSSVLNAALGTSLRPSELRAWSEDDDRDGRAETLVFVLRMPLGEDERVHSVSLMLGLDVLYDRATSLRTNSSVFVQHNSPLPGLRSSQSADLVLVSERALRAGDRRARAPCTTDFWMLQTPVALNGAPNTIANITNRYLALCNDTMRLQREPPIWTPGVSDAFEMELRIRVRSRSLVIQPNLLEVLKLAFVQYLAFFIVLHALLRWVKGTVIKEGVVAVRMHHPIKQHRF
ncbi:hypothetical protein AB1Y20_002278 [Prymnesium parvum]|uniref:Transmembrane protein 231 n=1 Tax=Prymnesium parvum TaxID=97485 RepID=A0AB34JA78_PRYPA